ncbi:ABC transporter ATP-binding protein [Azoarcus sp. KH32C]|uniref:ATP-binding cassette domain-containing protein n=1 Tax=Azoarcus sp. KH32C TaxID=748247 RepID=UPI00023867C4|nr:ABC transporter ATP-binding protein [Azoarcus sp. KH32C]BAL22606.1 ABC transporter related protein [Azoarcus sp. KH32C]
MAEAAAQELNPAPRGVVMDASSEATPPAPPEPSEQPVSLAALYRALWLHAEGARPLIFGSFALLLASQLFKLAVPWLAGSAINAIQAGGLGALPEAGRWLMLLFASIVATWLLHGPGRILERNVAMRVREQLSELLVRRLLQAPLAWHERHHSGEITHRVQQSTGALYDFAQNQFIYLQNTVQLIGPVVALWLISPLVGSVAVVGYGLIAFLITRFDHVMMRIAVDTNRAERAYTATLVDVLGNVLSVLALRRGEGVARLIAARLAQMAGPLKRSIVLNEAKWCSVDLLASLLWCVLVTVYAMQASGAVGGAAAAGVVTGIALGKVFMVYEYAQQAGGVITAIASHFQSLARQRADYAAGEPMFSAPVAAEPMLHLADGDPWQRLALTDLRFSHAAAHEAGPRAGAVIDIERLELERGRHYALVGPSGAGKSTLLRLLAGLDCPQAGAVSFDGRAEPEPAAMLRGIATLIPQQAEMFDGTLAENLLLGADLSAEHIAAALEAACAGELVEDLRSGLATRVVEGGANWSGGQRQRLALARGVLAAEACSLVLLDEPTSALDPETEARVYGGLFEHFVGATLVSSVHRLHLLDRFDSVILMQAGCIVGAGSAWELAQSSALFREMLAAQEAGAKGGDRRHQPDRRRNREGNPRAALDDGV